MIQKQKETKGVLAQKLGISRASLYYVSRQLLKDWELKMKIEAVLPDHPSYGYRRIADHLHINKKRAQRVMKLFGLKAYRRRGKKPKKTGVSASSYPNLLKTNYPVSVGDIWASDFTYIPYKGRFLYLATVLDLFSREVVGWAVMNNHSASLVLQAFFASIAHHGHPRILHSDNGREYGSKAYRTALTDLGISISRSAKGCPWENGYQESFYSQFKVDLGDPNRFKSVGELVYELHHLIWEYNNTRIHSAFRMPPKLFAERYEKVLENVS